MFTSSKKGQFQKIGLYLISVTILSDRVDTVTAEKKDDDDFLLLLLHLLYCHQLPPPTRVNQPKNFPHIFQKLRQKKSMMMKKFFHFLRKKRNRRKKLHQYNHQCVFTCCNYKNRKSAAIVFLSIIHLIPCSTP